jgi:hypothetical protein
LIKHAGESKRIKNNILIFKGVLNLKTGRILACFLLCLFCTGQLPEAVLQTRIDCLPDLKRRFTPVSFEKGHVMTKIDGISKGSQPVSPQKLQETDSDLFKKTLDEALKVKEGLQTEKLSPGILKEIASSSLQPVADAPQDFNQRTNQLLDLLDHYVRDLGNPEKTLREVEPLVKQLKTGAEELLEMAEKEILQDSPLRTIAEEGAMRANIEYIKFYRGDYL